MGLLSLTASGKIAVVLVPMLDRLVHGSVGSASYAQQRDQRSRRQRYSHELTSYRARTVRDPSTAGEIRPGGTVVIQRPYIRLDRRSDTTRRAYAEEHDIRLRGLGWNRTPAMAYVEQVYLSRGSSATAGPVREVDDAGVDLVGVGRLSELRQRLVGGDGLHTEPVLEHQHRTLRQELEEQGFDIDTFKKVGRSEVVYRAIRR